MLQFQLLGEVAVVVDGCVVDAGHEKQRCVLAALAVDVDRVVSVDRLTERVWGDDPPLRARGTLVGYLSRLRRVLATVGTPDIVRRSGGYSLKAEPSAVDLHRFRALCAHARSGVDRHRAKFLKQALELWRGDALSGIGGGWALAERGRLHQERLDAECDLTDALLHLGHGEDLVTSLSSRSAVWPMDERVAGHYMLALSRAGRTADALAHYRQVRERLVAELGIDPGPGLRELHQRILATEPSSARPGTGTGKRWVVPRQLPAAPSPFTGRVRELAELDSVLAAATGDEAEPGSPVVFPAIAGAGGIGKTWLALTWAHRNVDRFPDGQLFVDLRGFSPTGRPMTADVVVRSFLEALGVGPDRLPVDLAARTALYRSLIADRRMLIVLDNVATADQAVPLLPGSSSCAVLVTSRNRLPALLTRHGARPVQVDVLTDSEARTLLDAAFEDARANAVVERAVTELIGLCGGFPLALGLIAAHLRTQPGPLDDIVTDLRRLGLDALDSDDPDASLPAVLSWSLRHLTEQQRTAFALLGIAPGPDTDLLAAASLTGLLTRDTRAALRGLVDASLVTQTSDGRFAMHDLVRDYAATTAREHLPEPTRQAALNRVVDFYLHTAHTAERLLHPHRTPIRLDPPVPGVGTQPLPDIPAALAWLDAHHPHLLAAQHTAITHHRHQTVWHLAWALTTYHWRRGNRHDQLIVWQAAVDAAERLPDPTTRTLACRVLGYAHAELGQHEQAVDALRRALVLAERHDDPVQQALTHHALGRAWALREDDRRALEHARLALDLFRVLDQPVQEALALNQVGWLAACLGDHGAAREHCLDALVLFRRHENPDGEAATLDSLGFIDHRTGRHPEAIHHYEQALTLFRTLGNATEAANTLDNLGQPLAALGRHVQARAAWEEALELYLRSGRTADAERVRRRLDAPDGPPDSRPVREP
ncbi:BTAD domain-containing putative transcriptional regulator [Actinosynnema sp. NPDC050436]|uniref:AfsR/SARP family transcriptional regulator n=1 Tax=Actinosynnema sp. NPDC050436 TaxID=3155659 RepID=UPI0033C0DA1B